MIIYLFGLPAAGKNYVGKILSEEFGFLFYDADVDLTEGMKESIQRNEIFTKEDRDKYYNIIIGQIKKIRTRFRNIAIMQSTFKEEHRQIILTNFPDIKFVLVRANDEIRNIRLKEGNNLIDVNYSNKISRFFEEPKHRHHVIDNNNGRENVVKQLRKIISTDD